MPAVYLSRLGALQAHAALERVSGALTVVYTKSANDVNEGILKVKVPLQAPKPVRQQFEDFKLTQPFLPTVMTQSMHGDYQEIMLISQGFGRN